jgi:sugar O-acyltransferase (sialic acid O-acetyltransferase NeuD family)
MKHRKLVIVGAGETALLAYEYFTLDSDYEVVGFSVEQKYIENEFLLDLPVIPFEILTQEFPPKNYSVFVAISSTGLNRLRTRFYETVKTMGYFLASYVSSKAFVWHNVRIGENCFILENNTLQPFVEVGNNVTIWSGNHIGHRSKIYDNCFITSHVVISGFCCIKDNCFIGVNVTISDNITIEKDCLISLGSVIARSTEPNSIYKGNPAQKHKINTKTFFGIIQ